MYKQKFFTWFSAITLLLFLGSCEKEQTPEKRGVFVSTGNVTDAVLVPAGTITVTAGGDADVVGQEIVERGVVWASSAKPTTDNNKISMGAGPGNFKGEIAGFPYGDTFYIRAYVISNNTTYYGKDVQFQAVLPPVELIKNGDFKLPDDNVKYLSLNDIPDWKTDYPTDAGTYTGREYDPWRKTGAAYIVDWANFYQVVEEVPAVKSNYKIKFDANYIYTDWEPYAPKFYVTISTFTGSDPSTRTPIQTLEIASGNEYWARANSWTAYEANFSIAAGSPHVGKKLVIEWSMENYQTESWGWSNTYYNFDNISVLRSLE